MEKTITIAMVEVTYDLESLANEVRQIPYNRENFVNHHRTSGDGISLHEEAPTEDEFTNLKNKFADEILTLSEHTINRLITDNLFLTKRGIPAKGRRRIILEAERDFYVNVIDEYDHDLQFDRPYVKLDMVTDRTAKLIIWKMQTNY
jgi:hypothetical protein